MLSTITAYQLVAKNLTRSLANTAKQPDIARESQYYLSKIGQIKTIDDFLADRRVFAFAMKAFGLDDMVNAKAYMKKVLTEGTDSQTAFANKLSDPRFKEFATAFNFARYGKDTTVFDRTRQAVVDKYVRNALEDQVGETSAGAKLALYFQRKAPDIKSAYQIMADKELLNIALTTIGLDSSAAQMPLDKLASVISEKIDVTKLSDPTYVQNLMTRFGSLYDIQNNTATSPALTILTGGGSSNTGFSVSLLQSLQRLRLGG